MNTKMKLLVGLTLSAGIFIGCGSKSSNYEKNNLAIMALITGKKTAYADARAKCVEATERMNQCVGSNNGFNANNMCSDSQIEAMELAVAAAGTAVASLYSTLITCVIDAQQISLCNLPQNRVATPAQAKANFFNNTSVKSCDTPSGIIVTY